MSNERQINFVDELADIANTLQLLKEDHQRHSQDMETHLDRLTSRIYAIRGLAKRSQAPQVTN
jgi:hypothetical protein